MTLLLSSGQSLLIKDLSFSDLDQLQSSNMGLQALLTALLEGPREWFPLQENEVAFYQLEKSCLTIGKKCWIFPEIAWVYRDFDVRAFFDRNRQK